MISVQDAFKKFKTRLEITPSEQADASRRQKEIRAVMDDAFDIEHDFLTGSYARWTKTKPLQDVDIFCVLGEDERHYRDEPPAVLLNDVENVLVKKYGRDKVVRDTRAVTVNFGVDVVDEDAHEQVVSFDVVPAFAKGDDYEIPDTSLLSGWIQTNPRIHDELEIAAHEAYSQEWKGLVRMMKAWNRKNDRVITPSFLIEVMALQLLNPPFGDDFRYELKAFFASLRDGIDGRWPDPAGIGPDVSDGMTSVQRQVAKQKLTEAQNLAASAIQLEKNSKQGEALKQWRQLFGPLFPLS